MPLGPGRGRRDDGGSRRGGGVPGRHGCAGDVWGCWVPAGDAGMTEGMTDGVVSRLAGWLGEG